MNPERLSIPEQIKEVRRTVKRIESYQNKVAESVDRLHDLFDHLLSAEGLLTEQEQKELVPVVAKVDRWIRELKGGQK